jgi:hypothetical protein
MYLETVMYSPREDWPWRRGQLFEALASDLPALVLRVQALALLNSGMVFASSFLNAINTQSLKRELNSTEENHVAYNSFT